MNTDINSRTGELDRSELELIPKLPETPATLAAKRSYLGRVYLDWAQYPYVTEEKSDDLATVYFSDLRFRYPPLRERSPLSCSVEVDKNLHIVREAFGRREQKPPLD